MGLIINDPFTTSTKVEVPAGSHLSVNFANIFRSTLLPASNTQPFTTKWMMHGGYTVTVNSEKVFEEMLSIHVQDSDISQPVYPYLYNYIKTNLYKNTTDS